MNLYQFPTHLTKDNDSLVQEFELMTAEMTNQGMVRFLTGFLVAKFHMYAESSQNYALRQSIYEQLPKLEKERLSKKDFIRGIVMIMQKNGHMEKIYDGSPETEKPEKLDLLVMNQFQTPKKSTSNQEDLSMKMISQKQEEKPINRMKSEEERISEKMQFEQKMFMNEITKRKQNQFQSKQDESMTAIAKKFKEELKDLQEIPNESMKIAPKRLMEEYVDERILEEDDEFYKTLQVLAEIENQERDRCVECSKFINLQDIGRLECTHMFHRDCIIKLIQSSIHLKRPLKECPVLDCKKNIQIDDIKMYIEGQELETYAELVVLQNWNDAHLGATAKGGKKQHQMNQKDEKENEAEINQPKRKDSAKKSVEKKELKKDAEYKKCPLCREMVGKVSDSNELLCNCGARICMNCGGSWCNKNKCLYDQFSNVRPEQPSKRNQGPNQKPKGRK